MRTLRLCTASALIGAYLAATWVLHETEQLIRNSL